MCGGVRFEVTEEPLSAGYCHCTRCQRRTGTAASAQARLAPGSFRLLAGEELVREYAPEDGWPKCFCSVVRQRALEQVPGHGRGRERPARALRPGPRDPAAVAHVRRLRVRVGADPRRRPRALPRRQAALAVLADRGVEVALRGVGRPAEVEALRLLAAELAHDRVLLGGLDPLGDEVELSACPRSMIPLSRTRSPSSVPTFAVKLRSILTTSIGNCRRYESDA